MLINSDFLVPLLKNKMWHKKPGQDRHLICPKCQVRTKLFKLNDGRRKCGCCGKKFSIRKIIHQRRLRQTADILTGFCLDFSAHKTAKHFKYRYRFVWETYNHFRHVLAAKSLGEEKLKGIVEADESYFGGVNRKRNKKYRKPYVGRGRGTDKTPVFGVKEREGRVFIDILKDFTDDTIQQIFDSKVEKKSKIMTDEFKSYKGLIHNGYIHRFVQHGKEEYAKGPIHINGMENFWSWAKEKMFKFHGVFRKNLILYLKEIEWKFNYRYLRPEDQAKEIARLLPLNFLQIWSKK